MADCGYLINVLYQFGLCVSYSEVLNFEACAADQLSTDLYKIDIGFFLHFVAKSLGHNSDAIDGLNTFHGMAIITCVTNAKTYRLPAIRRKTIESSEILKTAKLEVNFFNFSCDNKPLKILKDIRCNVALDKNKVLGNVWQYVWLGTPMKPLWDGFMKASYDRPSKTAIHFEPMIDMFMIILVSTRPCCLYQTWLENIVMILTKKMLFQ